MEAIGGGLVGQLDEFGLAGIVHRTALHQLEVGAGGLEDEHRRSAGLHLVHFEAHPEATSLRSVSPAATTPWKMYDIDGPYLRPLLGTLEYGLPSDHLQEGIAAALHYRNEDDPQAVELQAMLAELGPARTLARVTGLDEHSDVVRTIVARYNNLK